MRTFSANKPPTKRTRASMLVHGLTGTGKTTRSLEGGKPLCIVTEPKAEAHVLKLNPEAICVVPESCQDILKICDQLADPKFLDKGFTRIVLDSFTELTEALPNWILVHQSGNPKIEIGRRIAIDEYRPPIASWAMHLVKAIQNSGLPSIIICRSEAKESGRIMRIVPAGLGSSPKNLPAQLLPTVEARYDDELRDYILDSRPDEYSQRCGLPWLPQVYTGAADEFLALIENGTMEQSEQLEPQQEQTAIQPKQQRKRKAKEPDQPSPQKFQPQTQPVEPLSASQDDEGDGGYEGNGTDTVESLSPEQRNQIRYYLNTYRVDTIAFLNWAISKGLTVTDTGDVGIDDLRADQFEYLTSLFLHERSRLNFVKHLQMLKLTA